MKKIIQYDYYVEGQKVSVKPEEPIECSDDAEVERQRKILKEKLEWRHIVGSLIIIACIIYAIVA